MNTSAKMSFRLHRYQLRFRSLFHEARGYSFPCDAQGHVDLDTLSDRAVKNYLYARTVVGRELSIPEVETSIIDDLSLEVI